MASKLREVRKLLGMRAPEMAEKLNISPEYLYDLERGRRRINQTLLDKIYEEFGINPNFVLGKDDHKIMFKLEKNKQLKEIKAKLDKLAEQLEKILLEEDVN